MWAERRGILTLGTSSNQLTELSDRKKRGEGPIPACLSRQLISDSLDGVCLRIATLTPQFARTLRDFPN